MFKIIRETFRILIISILFSGWLDDYITLYSLTQPFHSLCHESSLFFCKVKLIGIWCTCRVPDVDIVLRDRTRQLWKYCSLCWLSRMWELFPQENVMWMCAALIRSMLMSVFMGWWLCSAVDAWLSDFQLLDISFYLICHVVRMLCYIYQHSFHNSLDTLSTRSPLCNRSKHTHS